MDIGFIRKCCRERAIEYTRHALVRMTKRNITSDEIKEALMSGEIIEEYPEAFPKPACLILGRTEESRFLHVVIGIYKDYISVVTAYEPNDRDWETDLMTRKDRKR